MIYSDFMNGRFRRIYLSDGVNLTFKVSANTTNETCDKVSLKSHSIAVGLFLSVFILFAVLGNILVILSVLCHRHLQTVTNIFIVNLAVADLLLSVIVLPFSASSEVLGCWIFGRYFCNIWAALDVLCCTASILSLCVISIDRYIGVKYSFKYPTIMTEKKARVILVLLWVLSVVVSVGPLLGWKEPPPLHDSICNITEDPGYALFSSIFSFYFPLTIILVMYFRIYVVAKRTTKCLEAGMKREGNKSMEVLLRIHCRSVPRPAVPNGQTPFRNSLSVRFLKFSKEKKAAKTLAVVVGVFILCWLPFFFVLPLGSLFPSLKPSEMVFKVIFWLGYFNSCVNPIIYPCSSKEFKRAFVQLLRCQCHPRSRACRTLGDQRWRASMSRSDGGAFSITFSTPDSASWRDSLLRKDAGGAFCLQGWRFLSPLQSSSSQLREKVHSLSKKIKRGHRRSWTQTLSTAGFDSVPMGIFSGPESCDVHDVAQYRVLKETDI